MDPLLGILLFIAVMAIAAVAFGGWVLMALVRAMTRLLGLAPRGHLPDQAAVPAICPRERCRAENPGEARFCRRCGQPMRPAAPPARRAAML